MARPALSARSRLFALVALEGWLHIWPPNLAALAFEGDLENFVTLNRVAGQDRTGTLYIGESGKLSSRLNRLRLSTHEAMGMLRQISILNFPLNKLGVALLFTGRDTTGVERDLIQAYMNSFGDTPPLNYKL